MNRWYARQCSSVLLLALAAASARAETYETRLRPSNPLTSDIFGYDIDIDGTTVVGGAPFATISGVSQPGRAVIFHRVAGVWSQAQVIRPSHIEASAWFGLVVAVSGSTIAIGAPGEDGEAGDEGAVYIFENVGGTWTETAHLTAGEAVQFTSLGSSVALEGDTLLAGADSDTTPAAAGAGAVYVFERSGGAWIQVAKLYPADGATSDGFGAAVGLSGALGVAGAPGRDVDGKGEAGAAYVLRKTAGTWQVSTPLAASDGLAGSNFAEAVAISGSTIVAGAHRQPLDSNANAGEAYIFDEIAGTWSETKRLTAFDAAAGDHYGVDVAIEDGVVAVGSYLDANGQGSTGSAYFYRRELGLWQYHTKLIAPDAGGILTGWRLALSGPRAVLAAPFYSTNHGAGYVFSGVEQFCLACDVNCDGSVNQFDINPFVGLLGHSQTGCSPCAGDANSDGTTNQFDINAFIACLTP